MARAVRTAADLGASVINISSVACTRAESPLDDRALGAALSYAVDVKNVVVVAAAGNTGTGQCPAQQVEATWDKVTVVVSPAWYDDYVLTVGSVNAHGEPSAFTLAGPWVDVAAPGEGVISLSSSGDGLANALDGQQGSTPLAGTSYAAPIVSGLAALVRSRFPLWTARQVMQRIKATAHHPPGGWDPRVGAGLVDLLAAISTDAPAAPASPPARKTAPVLEPAHPAPPDHRARNTAFTGAAVCGGLLAAVLALTAMSDAVTANSDPTYSRRPEHPGRLTHWPCSIPIQQAMSASTGQGAAIIVSGSPRSCAASSSWTAYRTPLSETKYRVPAPNIAAGQAGSANISTTPGWEIDGVDGWTLSVGLRQGHRLLTVRKG